jgi:predicted short-subunit dehydrogenase-like oxidoreductase (DUF2520 family)
MIHHIVIIGSGNVATCLGKSLHSKGINIKQVYSPNLQHANKLANMLASQAINNFSKMVTDADLYLICVNDNAIEQVANSLTFEPGMVAHTSGSIGIGALARFKQCGVFYPYQTFTAGREINLMEVPFCIEGNTPETTQSLKQLAFALSNTVFEVNSPQRLQLHLAAVFANNFVNYFYDIAHNLLTNSGLTFDILKPLLAETLNKAIEIGPHFAQTGPARRGDFNVIKRHCELLNNPDLEKLYSFVSQNIYSKYHKQNEQF